MTRYAPLWLQQAQYAASVDRRLIGAIWPAGGSSGCALSPASGMGLSVAAGAVAVPCANGTGSVLCSSDAAEAVSIGAAPPSGTDRIDLVVCQARGNDLDGGANNDFLFAVVAGPQGSPPTAPAVPANAVALAQVYVTGGAASIGAADITDRRRLMDPGSEPPTASASTVGVIDTAGQAWVAKAGVDGGRWHPAREVMYSTVGRSGPWTINSTVAPINFDSWIKDTYQLYSGPYSWVAPIAGWWRVRGNLSASSTAAGQTLTIHLKVNTTSLYNAQAQASTNQRFDVPLDVALYCAAGDVIQLCQSANATLNGTQAGFGVTPVVGTFHYLGSG